MKKVLLIACLVYLVFIAQKANGQRSAFIHALNVKNTFGSITSLAKDHQGYLWFGCNVTLGAGGLHRFDGSDVISFLHDPKDSNSLANNNVLALFIDSAGMIWIATWGSGLDRFDPQTKTFTHFKQDSTNKNSISDDNVTSIAQGPPGKLWVGTLNGLNLLDIATGKFVRYEHQKNNAASISNNYIKVLFPDKAGTLWIGTYGGGLNKFDLKSNNFFHYMHDTARPESIVNNYVSALYFDNKGVLWVGNLGGRLQSFNSQKGVFSHYLYDPQNLQQISPPPPYNTFENPLTVISEDAAGNYWIGGYACGLNKYDPVEKKLTHYSRDVQNNQIIITPAPLGDSLATQASCAISSNDGLFWLSTSNGNLYYFNALKRDIQYVPIQQQSANAFYEEKDGALWMATDNGLVYQSANGTEKIFTHEQRNSNSLSFSGINTLLPDENGRLWVGTNGGGLDLFDPARMSFIHYRYDPANASGLSNNYLLFLFKDHHNDLWIASQGGLDKMISRDGKFLHYRYNNADSNSISSNLVLNMVTYQGQTWAGTVQGLDRLDTSTGGWKHYLLSSTIKSLFVDHKDILWTGTSDGLYHFNTVTNEFSRYIDPGTQDSITGVLSVMEDNNGNLWVATSNAIYRINKERDRMFKFGPDFGVHTNNFLAVFGLKTNNGNLLLGDQGGYYVIDPGLLGKQIRFPKLLITGFLLDDKEVTPGNGSPLSVPISQTKKIELRYDQNSFSFNFQALHFNSPGNVTYRYQMKNYDDVWHETGAQQKAIFYRLPPGDYIFNVKAINGNNAWTEKSIEIIINPPWWKTWWAYAIYASLLVLTVWGMIQYRSRNLKRKNRLLELKVSQRTKALEESLQNLRTTQKQLIQTEKMASLGELTAGIAHEIQNPLNFVNNFSDINTEIIEDLKAERSKPAGERNEQYEEEIINDLQSNSEKINHHGKRAGAIVRGMLEHSKISSGKREPTDINALCDEYLRLSYHGMKAKNPDFDVELRKDFDPSLSSDETGKGKINIQPQDIGRVLQNLFNNAFYACAEQSRNAENDKKAESNENYQPLVKVSTQKVGDAVLITVTDNGTGIPQKIVDKIFQPFFTTKPTGQGTGLGLSLSYDIVKAHGGELKVESKEGSGSEFIVQLPLT